MRVGLLVGVRDADGVLVLVVVFVGVRVAVEVFVAVFVVVGVLLAVMDEVGDFERVIVKDTFVAAADDDGANRVDVWVRDGDDAAVSAGVLVVEGDAELDDDDVDDRDLVATAVRVVECVAAAVRELVRDIVGDSEDDAEGDAEPEFDVDPLPEGEAVCVNAAVAVEVSEAEPVRVTVAAGVVDFVDAAVVLGV